MENSEAKQPNENSFDELITLLAQNAHGVKYFSSIKSHIGTIENTAKRKDFLNPYLTQNKVEWENVKTEVWETEDLQNANRFQCLQGDIIATTLVMGIGKSKFGESHSLWLVLSPDCDCIRSKYIKVAPIFAADKEDAEYSKHKQTLTLAFKLVSPKFFPIGLDLFGNDFDGYYADISEPYYLSEEDKKTISVAFSLKKEGWHILNAVLKESETRANIEEGEKIRSSHTPLHQV